MHINRKTEKTIRLWIILLAFVFTAILLFSFQKGQNYSPAGAAGPLPGDADGNCHVDGVDFVVWLNHYGQSGTGATVGDFDSSGTIDGVDFVIWLNHYGQTCTTSTPTPTPASATNTPTPTGTSGTVTYDQVLSWATAYKAAHPGNGGKDWDINAKTPAQLANDPAARQLRAICGPGQLPVIPMIAWEYGGNDHQWIHPEASALAYCVYIPVNPGNSHWSYNAGNGRVTGDTYVLFPDQNPCKNRTGRDQVIACLGDPTNSEILVDTMSLNDGHDVGLELSEASTEVFLILPDGTKVQLLINI